MHDDNIMDKKTLKVNFVDYWSDLTDENNFFLQLLQKNYHIEISNNPDILFYSCFGAEHLQYNCKKILYLAENRSFGYRNYDFSFSFLETTDKNFYLPHFVDYEHFFEFVKGNNTIITTYREKEKKEFCAFIASNKKSTERIRFVQKLMKYKRVHCYGSVLYNMEEKKSTLANKGNKVIDRRKEKNDIIKQYKFTIAFENTRSYNYVTEKIYQPLLVGSIPIYWGAPNIADLFNPQCYINISDFDSFDEAIEWIARVDQDNELYQSYFQETPVHVQSKVRQITEESIISRIQSVFDSEHKPLSSLATVRNYLLYFCITSYIFGKKAVKASLALMK